MLFAHLKRILGLVRFRLRGPCGVQDEFNLAATAQNLRKLAKLKPMTTATGRTRLLLLYPQEIIAVAQADEPKSKGFSTEAVQC
jgi:hypothetical protein